MSSSAIAVSLDGDSSLPSWFKPTRFLDIEFDADAYVSDLRRFVPLETLSSQLQKYLTVLKGKLVEVINEDYNDFVSLSTKLVNVDGAVTQMQMPLLTLKDKLISAQAAVQSELNALNQGLQRRQQAAKVKALLELMQDTAHVMSKVEKLLAEVDALIAQQGHDNLTRDALDSRTRLYERVASEVSRLKYYLAKGDQLPILQQLQPRADSAVERLSNLLSQALDAALREGHQSAVLHCLQAYTAVGDTHSAEQVVRQALVVPLVESVIAEEQEGRALGAAPASDQLAPVLETMLTRVQEGCGELLQTTMAPQSGLQTFNLLGNSILAAVDQQVASSLPGAFSPGVPTSFISNYRAAMQFLDQLESMCTTKTAFQALRDSPAYDSFLRRWKLSVYFSLRFQEIAGPLEASVALPSLTTVTQEQQSSNSLQLQLQPSLSLWHALQRRSVSSATGRQVCTPCATAAGQICVLGGRGHCFQKQWGSYPFPRGPSVNPQATGDRSWAGRASPEQLALVRADLDSLAAWTQDQFWPEMRQRLSFLPTEVVESIGSSFKEAQNSLTAQAGPVKNAIVSILLDRCLTVLRQLRGITATYRMTARPLPTRPSHYVGGVLQPLRAFLGTDAGKRLQPSAQQEVAEGVAATVSQQYASMVSELLDMLQKTEQSLARVRRNKPADSAAAGDGSELSNIQKISLQLFLDVKEFGVQLQKHNVQPSSLTEYQDLWSIVAPEDKPLGEAFHENK
ncbi:MAG: conserved oligomeric Golgi complex subunit 2-like [Trebouxia sp. A1-2]|nr:MAG: conserved oligomeric Golgi complex subunit 2-like [Trebouxia sp. A1-2]